MFNTVARSEAAAKRFWEILRPMIWDLFCHVIDNWGDAGVCWRLAADLRARGERVRLWIDQPEALRWMAPDAEDIWPWNPQADGQSPPDWPEPGDVVIEAFGCNLPPSFVERMAQRHVPPVWINLEYLTAEPYAERSHGLRSPQQGVAQGLGKWFFYPGWTPGSGGLVREPDLAERQARFDANAWLAAHRLQPRPGERRVSLFCYQHTPALPSLLDALQTSPTLLMVTSGQAEAAVCACLGDSALDKGQPLGHLRLALVPPLSQIDYDHLLWAADVNFVRGEDSFVRAQWAARPFVWQIYPQTDDAHLVKLQAFHRLWQKTTQASSPFIPLSLAWNDAGARGDAPWPSTDEIWSDWNTQCQQWAQGLRQTPDLTTRLEMFVNSHKSTQQG